VSAPGRTAGRTEPVAALVPFTVRPIEPEELNLVLSDWKESYRRQFKFLPDSVYHIGMEKMIGALAMNQKLVVAVASEDGEAVLKGEVLGWLCFRERYSEDPAIVVHYSYVKARFRKHGVATALMLAAAWIPGMPILTSHIWHAPRPVRRKHLVFYNPFFVTIGNA
jgi:GNAT superfamily N-acetyltransferase